MGKSIGSWECYTRSLFRIILAFTFSLHGYRHLFGLFPVSGGRRARIPMALDALPSMVGGLEILGGLILFFGLFTRVASLILCAEMRAAYVYTAAPLGPWPIGAGVIEVLLSFLPLLYLATHAAGGA